jgi:hypothetical protein
MRGDAPTLPAASVAVACSTQVLFGAAGICQEHVYGAVAREHNTLDSTCGAVVSVVVTGGEVVVSVVVSVPNVAVTVTAVLPVSVQFEVPAQPPLLHPLKVEPVAGAAASVTEVPPANVTAQTGSQLIPDDELLTTDVGQRNSRALTWNLSSSP